MTGQNELAGTFRFEDVASSASRENYEKLEDITKLVQFDDPVNIQVRATSISIFSIYLSAKFIITLTCGCLFSYCSSRREPLEIPKAQP